MTDFNHTSTLEVYQHVYLPLQQIQSKTFALPYSGTTARAQLAFFDFNTWVGLAHRKNKQGDLQYKYQFSKLTQSWVVKKIFEKEEQETYKNQTMDEIKHLQMTSCNYEMPILPNVPKYIGGIEKPGKA